MYSQIESRSESACAGVLISDGLSVYRMNPHEYMRTAGNIHSNIRLRNDLMYLVLKCPLVKAYSLPVSCPAIY